MSIFFALSFSLDNKANPLSLSCPTVLLKWFLMSFNLENEHSEVATVTGRVKNKRRAVQTSLNVEVTVGWLTRSIFARSATDFCFVILSLKEVLKQSSCPEKLGQCPDCSAH